VDLAAPYRRTVLALSLAILTCTLTACSALSAATALPGQRPGVDVPSRIPLEAARQPLGQPAIAPGGSGGYTFLVAHPDGSPVAFDPCRPVHVVVRPDGEPPGGRSLLLSVLGELSAATGLQFIDDGATTEGPDPERPAYQPERYGDRWAPVLVVWSSPAETTMLEANVLGRAGPDPFGTGADQRYVSGLAVFNAPALTDQLTHGDDEKARAVLLHELGHLVGLGHVTDPFQVMYDTNSYPLARYRAGDRRGLAELGLGRCFDDR
jgi:Matrixin